MKNTSELPMDLGKLIEEDTNALKELGWKKFVQLKRGKGDLGPLNFDHPATRILKQYKLHGVPVKLSTQPWSRAQIQSKLHRGPHKSCHEHLEFLQEEFVDMINKKQWVILPYTVAQDLPGLRLSPPGVVPQRERRPRWICDYSYYQVNDETVELFFKESMQFGHALDRILREILLANPKFGPVNLIKIDIADGFYRLDINPTDIPKLAVIFPTLPGQQRLVALPLVLPMGWKNSPPVFCTATETAADLANQKLCDPSHNPVDHKLALEAEKLHPYSDPPIVKGGASQPSMQIQPPIRRDPSIPTKVTPLSSVDVFMDDFIALGQTNKTCRRVRNVLMNAIDQVFRPLEKEDNPYRTEPISLKKLRKGDCSWETCKTVLGWIINTVDMTIKLPEHRIQRLGDILASIPITQKRIGIKKWHKILGELRSMSLALPGARNLFSHMQLALTNRIGQRIALKKGVHHALDDFRYLFQDIANRPTRIAELVPLLTSAIGHHDASGLGAGGVWFVPPHISKQLGYNNRPVVWRVEWPNFIKTQLVTPDNPNGTITNSDLELAGGLLHLQALVQYCDVRERTVLSKTDNLSTLFWQRKGSATTDSCPSHLLRLFGLHQRFHRYVPRFDYLSGPSNPLADALSRHFHLSNNALLTHLQSLSPQKQPFQMLRLKPSVVSSVTLALQKKQCRKESLLVVPKPPKQPGHNGKNSVLSWPSIPYSKPSKTKYQSYKSLDNVFEQESLHPKEIPSALDRLRITYGTLAKRSLEWGPKIPV